MPPTTRRRRNGSRARPLRPLLRLANFDPEEPLQIVHLRQSGIQKKLGEGLKTISSSGCMLVSLVMASNALQGARTSVELANDLLVEADAFIGSSLVVSAAARRLGMSSNRAKLKIPELFAALQRGDMLVVLGIDYKHGRSSGFSEADHFVLAHSLVTDSKGKMSVLAADPATGTDVFLERIDYGGGDVRLIGKPSPRVTWRATEAIYLMAIAE